MLDCRLAVEYGANWGNFSDRSVTPDNVTLAEIVFIGFTCDCIIAIAVWYLDNVMPVGPGIARPWLYPFQVLVNTILLSPTGNGIPLP